MKVNHIRQNVFPVLAALIWGTAFVAQSVAADHVEPFTFTAARSAVAFVFLLVLCLVFRALRQRDFHGEAQPRPGSRRDLAVGGACCGVALTVATNLQQMGLETTTSGKAGFITALYIVIVPIAGIFLHKKAPRAIWLSVALAVAGLYLLCVQESFSITEGDIIGLDAKKILAKGNDIDQTTLDLIKRMKNSEHEMITLYYGEGIEESAAEALAKKVQEAFPDCDVDYHYGGQPVYYYMVSLE